MTSRRILFLLLFFFGSMAGCGGCESCFGSNSATDDAATPIETATIEPVVVDASGHRGDASDRDSTTADARADSGDAGSGLRREDIPGLPLVPRPKAPMPVGGHQSCGVYDGPLCKKDCDKGNCRQECEGVSCELTCKKGYCSQFCGPNGTCKMSCAGGHCVQICTMSEGCTKDCAGGDCE